MIEKTHQVFTAKLPIDLHRELKHFAVDDGRQMVEILIDAIEEYLARQREAKNVEETTA